MAVVVACMTVDSGRIEPSSGDITGAVMLGYAGVSSMVT